MYVCIYVFLECRMKSSVAQVVKWLMKDELENVLFEMWCHNSTYYFGIWRECRKGTTKSRQCTHNLILWRVRVMFIPLWLPKEPDTISLEENSFMATAVNVLRCTSSRTPKGGHHAYPLTSSVPTSVQPLRRRIEHPLTLKSEQSARSLLKVPDILAQFKPNFDFFRQVSHGSLQYRIQL